MPTAVSSWREEMYSGTSPGAYGLASASQSGAQSEPGEAKMRSTPILRSWRRTASAPVTMPLLSSMLMGSGLELTHGHAAIQDLTPADEATVQCSAREAAWRSARTVREHKWRTGRASSARRGLPKAP